MIVRPYILMPDGEWTIPDGAMREIFFRMVREGLVQKVFYDGKVVDPDNFTATMKLNGNHVITVWDESDLLAVVWLNSIGPQHGFSHFCTFRSARKKTKSVAQACFDYWKKMETPDGAQLFKIIMGKTPENNRAATIFLKRIGMKILGTIPGICWDAFSGQHVGGVISYKEI